MKKVLLILAAAATAMILFSCEKGAKKEPKVYETPIYENLAAKYDVEPVTEALSGIRSFEVTNAGVYVIEKNDKVISGKFEKESVDNGKAVLNLRGFGKVTILDANITKADANVTITFEPEVGSPIIVVAEPVAPTTSASSDAMAKLNRAWKVTATELVISDFKISKTFEGGCDIPAILKYLEGKIDNFKADKDYTGYVVKDLSITDNSIIVRFTDADALSAPLTIGANLDFSYKVTGEQVGNPIFNGEANGNISFDKWNEPVVSIKAKINDKNGKEYNGSVKFYLSETEAL
ncbi:MAG: hypothetical protein K6A64_00425 [Bacteroidales bacterium]|nr:hypothetical protein [Bacteroidales bacterium]